MACSGSGTWRWTDCLRADEAFAAQVCALQTAVGELHAERARLAAVQEELDALRAREQVRNLARRRDGGDAGGGRSGLH